MYPTLNAGVSVQSNNAGFNSAVANDIAAAFFADAMTGAPAPAPAAPTPARAAAPLSAAALAAFAGQYWSEELESSMTIVQRGDTLLLRQRRHEDAVLVPQAAADSFEGRTLTLSFERDRHGAVIGFYAANGRTRDVRFARMR
jgi:hypothetical protein